MGADRCIFSVCGVAMNKRVITPGAASEVARDKFGMWDGVVARCLLNMYVACVGCALNEPPVVCTASHPLWLRVSTVCVFALRGCPQLGRDHVPAHGLDGRHSRRDPVDCHRHPVLHCDHPHDPVPVRHLHQRRGPGRRTLLPDLPGAGPRIRWRCGHHVLHREHRCAGGTSPVVCARCECAPDSSPPRRST